MLNPLKIILVCCLTVLCSMTHAQGLQFACSPEQYPRIEHDMAALLADYEIPKKWLSVRRTPTLSYRLNDNLAKTTPVNFVTDPRFHLRDAKIALPTPEGTRWLLTVSKKEILLALLHPGRLTHVPCDVGQLEEHIALRQNIVAWSEQLNWQWPDGTAAVWNTDFWERGTPVVNVTAAVNDAFMNQKQYAIGCYTATKLAVTQGVLDFYSRVKGDAKLLYGIESCLWSDKDPLINIEPDTMWFFEDDYDAAEAIAKGKLMTLIPNVDAENFVPGDWVYLRNPDEESANKTGYEGSNAIYLGRGRFDDYYNDHNHAYTYTEKLDEVYQWRHGVYSRSRHINKVKPLTLEELRKLGNAPDAKGLVLTYRAAPYFYRSEGYRAWCRNIPAFETQSGH